MRSTSGKAGKELRARDALLCKVVAVPVPGEVIPARVSLRDQSHLLFPQPPLELLFPRDRIMDITIFLEENKAIGLVLLRKPFQFSGFVLLDTPFKIVRDSDIDRAGCAGDDVDVVGGHA